jgi:Ras-related GTP-binding protein C/D
MPRIDDDVLKRRIDGKDHYGDDDNDNTMNHHAVSEEEEDEDPRFQTLPGVLFLGPRRSGKTSIQRVVFQKMSPHETLFRLEPTQAIERTIVDHTSLCRFITWDFPGDYYAGGYAPSMDNRVHPQQQQYAPSWFGHAHGNTNYTDPASLLHYRDYSDSSSAMTDHNNNTTNANTMDAHQQWLLQGNNNSNNHGVGENDDSDVIIFSTSPVLVFVMDAQDEPYDHALQHFISTVSRALSINPNIAVEVFINKVDGELFLSDEAKYECRRDIMQQVSDELIDAQLDGLSVNYHLVSIYDHSIFEALSRVVQKVIPHYQPTLENLLNTLVGTCAMEKAYLFDVASKLYISTDSSPVDMQTVELCSDMIDVVLDVSGIYGNYTNNNSNNNYNSNNKTPNIPNDSSSSLLTPSIEPTPLVSNEQDCYQTATIQDEDHQHGEDEALECSAFDDDSSSVIRLSNGMILYLREVDSMLALVCLIRSENFRKKSLINYNIGCLKQSLKQLVAAQDQC